MDNDFKTLQENVESRLSKIQQSLPIKHIILDCSSINNIDTQGVNAIIQVQNILIRIFFFIF